MNEGFYPDGDVCKTKCGDGILAGSEACDDGNTNKWDGCSECVIQSNFICEGTKPTQCYPKIRPPIPPSDDGDNMNMDGIPNYNYNNVNIRVRTIKEYPNLNDYEKKNFIKYEFPDPSTRPASIYCLQNATQKNLFECLLVYASGVPNKKYDIVLKYDYNEDHGRITIKLDPLASRIRTRSLGP